MLYLIFTYVGYFFLIINFVLYTKGFFKFGKAFQIYVLYLFLLVIVQFAMEVLLNFRKNNLYLVHVYFIGQFVFLGLFYKILLNNTFQKKIVTISLLIGFGMLAVQYFLEPELIFEFNLLEIVVTSLLVVFFAMLYLYNMLTGEKKFYFITVGLIIYLLASTVLFLVGNLTINLSSEFKLMSWNLNAFFVIVNQLFILYEWIVSFRSKNIIKNKI